MQVIIFISVLFMYLFYFFRAICAYQANLFKTKLLILSLAISTFIFLAANYHSKIKQNVCIYRTFLHTEIHVCMPSIHYNKNSWRVLKTRDIIRTFRLFVYDIRNKNFFFFSWIFSECSSYIIYAQFFFSYTNIKNINTLIDF